MPGMSDLFELFTFVWHWLFEWFFGNTGRMVLKAITFGRVDLDLSRWGQCFLAAVVGLSFWTALLIGYILWQHPQLLSLMNPLNGFNATP